MDTRESLFRRKHPRRKFEREMSCLVHGNYLTGFGQEIGEGGLAFFSTMQLNEADLLVLNFQIPDGSFVSVSAEVRSVREDNGKYVVGCLFRNIKFEQKREIRTFVSARTA